MTNALALLLALHGRGVRFQIDGDALLVEHHGISVSRGELRLLKSLKPMILALLHQTLPAEAPERPCDAFDAAPGVALCQACGFDLARHFWKREGCRFHVGEAGVPCRRCGAPALEHLNASTGGAA